MKKYTVRVNCPAFVDLELEAKNKEEAIKKAENAFTCPGGKGEFCEFLDNKS